MGTLFTSLINSSNALQTYGRAFSVIQNNITNANTPGYAKQIPVVGSDSVLLAGGFNDNPAISTRSQYLEQAVRNQQTLLGDAQQRATDLGRVESQFNLSSASGVPAALNDFFNGFSTLAVNPNSSTARQSVIDLAGTVASAFQQNAVGLQQIAVNVNGQTNDTVGGINRIAQEIADINHQYRNNAGASSDPTLDAQLNSALEELSGLTNFTTVRTSDGAANVYLGGQRILVIGDQQRVIRADLSGPQTVIRDASGADVTDQVNSGQLGALVREKNTLLPGYTADLNTLASTFADNVNTVLSQGVDKNGLPPAAPFFTYTPASAASSLATNGITPDQIAAASPAAPGGNGNAIALAQLGTQPLTNGFTFAQMYGNLGSRVGRDVAAANLQQTQYEDTVNQARTQRGQVSDVSLDEEATRLLEYQRAYQAMSKMIGVLDTLTSTVLTMLTP